MTDEELNQANWDRVVGLHAHPLLDPTRCHDCPIGNRDPGQDDHDPNAGPCSRAAACDEECYAFVDACEALRSGRDHTVGEA